MTWQHTIRTASGAEAAKYSASTCACEAELEAQFHFADDPGGFEHYRAQFGTHSIWPMAVLLDVEVPSALRKQRYGRRAVDHFIMVAKQHGAGFALLRVGWPGGSSERGIAERNWRAKWYESLGWRMLRYPAEHIVIPFLYRTL